MFSSPLSYFPLVLLPLKLNLAVILEPNLEYRFVAQMAHFVQQHQWFGSYKESVVVWTVGLFGKHPAFFPDGCPSSPSLDPSLPDTTPSLERWLPCFQRPSAPPSSTAIKPHQGDPSLPLKTLTASTDPHSSPEKGLSMTWSIALG